MQVSGLNPAQPFRQHAGHLQRLLELAHVAGQRMSQQLLHRLRRQLQGRVHLREQALDQSLALALWPCPQRCQLLAPAADSVIEVLAKRPGLHHGRQIPVAGADQPEIHRLRSVAADRGNTALLQHPQQPGLGQQRQLANFIQHQDAAVGGAQIALTALAAGAAEGPAHIAKQLGLHQVCRQGATVDTHQGLILPARLAVQGAYQMLLAAAGFPLDKKRDAALQHLERHLCRPLLRCFPGRRNRL